MDGAHEGCLGAAGSRLCPGRDLTDNGWPEVSSALKVPERQKRPVAGPLKTPWHGKKKRVPEDPLKAQ